MKTNKIKIKIIYYINKKIELKLYEKQMQWTWNKKYVKNSKHWKI